MASEFTTRKMLNVNIANENDKEKSDNNAADVQVDEDMEESRKLTNSGLQRELPQSQNDEVANAWKPEDGWEETHPNIFVRRLASEFIAKGQTQCYMVIGPAAIRPFVQVMQGLACFLCTRGSVVFHKITKMSTMAESSNITTQTQNQYMTIRPGTYYSIKNATESEAKLYCCWDDEQEPKITGTDEAKPEEDELLNEISAIKERRFVPIKVLIGPNADPDPKECNLVAPPDSSSSIHSSQAMDPNGLVVAAGSSQTQNVCEAIQDPQTVGHQRDEALINISGSSSLGPVTLRRKRAELAKKKVVVLKKRRLGMESGQGNNLEQEKNRQFILEQKRLEIEEMKEVRLAEEGRRRDKLLETMCGQLLSNLQKIIDKRPE